MIKIGDLVKLYQEQPEGNIGVVVYVERTGLGWQRLQVQIGETVFATSTLQARLLANESRERS